MMFVAHVRCLPVDGRPSEVRLQRNRLDALLNDIVALVGDGATLSDLRAVRFDTLPRTAQKAWLDALSDERPDGNAGR